MVYLGIKIVGNREFLNQVSEALYRLAVNVPHSSKLVNKNFNVITFGDHTKSGAGQPSALVIDSSEIGKTPTWCAAALAAQAAYAQAFYDFLAREKNPSLQTMWDTNEGARKGAGARVEAIRKVGAPKYEIEEVERWEASHHR